MTEKGIDSRTFVQEMRARADEALRYCRMDWTWEAAAAAHVYVETCDIFPLMASVDDLAVGVPALNACRALAMLVEVDSEADLEINATLAKIAGRQLKIISEQGATNG